VGGVWRFGEAAIVATDASIPNYISNPHLGTTTVSLRK
jgi:hypothetical protein